MRIKRHFKLFWEFFKFSFKAETAFRANFMFYTLQNFLWLLLGVSGVGLIFGQVEAIAGWTKNEVFLVLFIAGLYTDVSWTLFFRNLRSFSRLIREGRLDYYLLKPVNLRFMLTFRVLEFDHYARILIELYLIYRYTVLVTGSFSLFNLLLFIILFTSGLLIFYSIFFAFSATNVWFIKLENLHHLFDSIKDIGKRPVDIFKNRLLLFFSYFLPVGYIATFPAKALLGEISFFKVVMGPVLTIVFFFLSQKFFKFALKHYSSASS